MIHFLAVALAVESPSAAPSPTPYHLYAVPAPVQPGVFRVRVSDEAGKQWAIEQGQSVSVYDKIGTPLPCETMKQSRLGATKQAYPLVGTWRKLDEDVVQAKGSYGALSAAWRFAMPAFGANESPYYLHFNWRSTAANPGEVRLVEVPPPSSPSFSAPVGIHLMDGQSDHAKGHVNLYLLSMTPKVWAPTLDLLFTHPQNELTIESPVLETLTKKPWTLTPAPGPGWIIFKGNGNVPYRLQLGEVLVGCAGANVTDESVSYADPNWPAEVVVGAEIAGAPHMGETKAMWNNQITERANQKALGPWISWGIGVGLVFLVALMAALGRPKR